MFRNRFTFSSELGYEFGTTALQFVLLLQPPLQPLSPTCSSAELHLTAVSTEKAWTLLLCTLSDRWLNLWVMILFLFTCKCLHFNEMEIPHLLYSKLMNRVSVIRIFFLQFKGQEDKRKENLLIILSLCCVTTRMVIFNKEIEIFMPEGLRFVEAVEL